MRYYREIILIIICISFIFILDFFTSKFAHDVNESVLPKIKDLIYEIDKIENDNIDKSQKEEMINKINDMYDTWKDKAEYLALFYEHNELEKVTVCFIWVKSNIEKEELNQARENLEEMKYWIEHVEEKSRFLLKNVF